MRWLRTIKGLTGQLQSSKGKESRGRGEEQRDEAILSTIYSPQQKWNSGDIC